MFGGLWAGTHRSTVKLFPVNKQVFAYTGRSTETKIAEIATDLTSEAIPLPEIATAWKENPIPKSAKAIPKTEIATACKEIGMPKTSEAIPKTEIVTEGKENPIPKASEAIPLSEIATAKKENPIPNAEIANRCLLYVIN